MKTLLNKTFNEQSWGLGQRKNTTIFNYIVAHFIVRNMCKSDEFKSHKQT